LQQPVGFEDADVRQMPDDRPKAEARTFVQILFARQIEERERAGARLPHLPGNLFYLLLLQPRFPFTKHLGLTLTIKRDRLS
jgi:hypothetical protein